MGAEKGLIFGSCPCASWDFLRPYRDWAQVVIGADGGLRLARAAGFSPEVYVGDGDSGGAPETRLFCVSLPAEKDMTDLEAAYTWARDHGLRELVFTGCTGGRLDHHMAALALLEKASREGIHGIVLDPGNRIEFLRPGRYRMENHGYGYFSLLPVDAVLRDVTISGARYPLEHRDVPRGSSLTVSNEFTDGAVEVSFRDGCCYFMETK